jgi:hypothetical protein
MVRRLARASAVNAAKYRFAMREEWFRKGSVKGSSPERAQRLGSAASGHPVPFRRIKITHARWRSKSRMTVHWVIGYGISFWRQLDARLEWSRPKRTRRRTRMIGALGRFWLHRTRALSTSHGQPGKECPPGPGGAIRPGVLRFSKGRGPGRGTLAACRAAVVRTPIILRLCWGPGGGGELGWRFAVHPA